MKPAVSGRRPGALGQAEEVDIKLIQVEFLNAPLGNQPLLVKLHQALLGTHPGEGVVRGIAQDHQDGFVPFDLFDGVPLLRQLREYELLLGALGGVSPGQGIGEMVPGPLFGVLGPEVSQGHAAT